MTIDELVVQFGHVWHVTFSGGWEGIQRTGLRSTVDLLGEAGRSEEASRVREEVVLLATSAGAVVLRNQVPKRRDLAPSLDGISVEDWWVLVNSRSYFFANERDVEKLLASYNHRGEVQEAIKFFSRPLLEPVAAHIEVSTVNAGVFPRQAGPSRGRSTFQPLVDFTADPRTIKEITVTCPVPIDEGAVMKVIRHAPDGAPVRLWPPLRASER